MANKKTWLGIMALVFTIAVVGCVGSTLNGTWASDIGDGYVFEGKYKNGKFEDLLNGIPQGRGTYTTKGNTLTFKRTHLYNSYADEPGLEVKWYTRSELKKAMEIDDDYLDHFFSTTTVNYSISGNIFTTTMENGETFTLVRTSSGADTRIGGSNKSAGKTSKITKAKLVGIWELENVENLSRRDLVDSIELFKDGTGIMQDTSITWQLRDGNRLQLDAGIGGTQIRDIELSEKDKLMTVYTDGRNVSEGHLRKATYRKRK